MKIDCLKIIEYIRQQQDLTERKKLTVIQVGHDPASDLYIKSKKQEAEKWNIECIVTNFPQETTTETLVDYLQEKNKTAGGIIVQLPLPKHIDTQKVIDAIPPELNVDGFKQTNKEPLFEPCTPKGIITLLKEITRPTGLQGKMVTLIGRGKTVGEPLRDMLLKENCTLAVCHSYTDKYTMRKLLPISDIVISAVGQPNLFEPFDLNFNKKTIIVDAGISRINGKQVGDFSHEGMSRDSKEILYTPWTNGVGKLTVMALMLNVRKV